MSISTHKKNWTEKLLGECVLMLSGGTPSKQNADYWHGDIPWASAKDLKNLRLYETQDYITKKGTNNGTRTAPKGSILILVRGMTLHNDVPICLLMQDMAFNQDIKAIIPNESIINTNFLVYWMLAFKPYLRSLVDSASHGTGRINTELLKSTLISFPSIPEQKAIAHILGTLDDKIELNQQMNQTLEAIARALFKSWFIDFDPVRAKMDGQQPAGMDAETAALFPAEFEDSALGKIPKGWKAVPLPEAIEVNPTRSLAKGKLAPYLDMQNMPTQGHRPNSWIYREFGSGTKFIQGDTLLARITPCLDNGKTAFVDFLPEGEVGWGSTEYIVLRPKPPLPVEFGYFLARSEELRTYAIQNRTGSSGRQRVPVNCFTSFLLAVPSNPVARTFGDVILPIMRTIKANSEQIISLTAIRNALLPKLLSGEIKALDRLNEQSVNTN